MQLLKLTTRAKAGAGDARRLAEARNRAGLDAGRITAAVLAGLGEALEGKERLRPVVEGAVGAWVKGELSFVDRQSKPEGVVATFYEEAEARSRRFAGRASTILSELIDRVVLEEGSVGVLEIEVPLAGLMRDVNGLVQTIVKQIAGLHFDGSDLELGAGHAKAVVDRLCRVSGLSLEEAKAKPHRLKWPEASSLESVALVNAYLGETALGALLLAPISVVISDKVRVEHCIITGGAGSGKTQILQHFITRDLDRPKGKEVGLVVIDSQGDLIRNITGLKCFAGADRLLVIDPSDVEYPVGLNIFNLGGVSLVDLSARDREQALASTTQLYEYVIGGLFGSEMSQKQLVVFRFLIRLMLSIDGATIHTLRQCLEEPQAFIDPMMRLGETAKQFFLKEFLDRQFGETRKQILRRLYGVLQNPSFERMFASTENRLDMYQALNEGRVVLCNTNREFLQDECRVFGRYCIAVALKAAFDRARLPLEQRRTSFLYVDEASDYFDPTVGQLLAQARKYRLGVVLAHQALDQMSDELRAIVMANTSIKMVGGTSAKDARYYSSEMRTSPEFILHQEKQGNATRFATFVRNITPTAVSWRLPFFTMENMPRMSEAESSAFVDRNRAELSSGVARLGVEALVADNDDRLDAFSDC